MCKYLIVIAAAMAGAYAANCNHDMATFSTCLARFCLHKSDLYRLICTSKLCDLTFSSPSAYRSTENLWFAKQQKL